jgi:hypothetical protein
VNANPRKQWLTGPLGSVLIATLLGVSSTWATTGSVGASTNTTISRNVGTDLSELQGQRSAVQDLLDQINQATAQVENQLDGMKTLGDQVSVTEMFKMQMLMNKLAQLSEMATSVISASNSAISSMARNVKS